MPVPVEGVHHCVVWVVFQFGFVGLIEIVADSWVLEDQGAVVSNERSIVWLSGFEILLGSFL